MAITEAQLSSLLATCLIPGILREAGVSDAQGVEDFFRSRVCAQLVNAGTVMRELGAVTLVQAWRMERDGIDYQEPRCLA